MGSRFQLRPATPGDLRTVIALIEGAARWLRTKDTDQWRRPWPNRVERDLRIEESLRGGESWILWDGAAAVATVTITPEPDRALWTEPECAEPAVYLHRLVVHRDYAGQRIGARLLDWAAHRARAEHDARWLRIDVWSDNYVLHGYYQQRGFRKVRQSTAVPGYPAGALFQRDTGLVRPRSQTPNGAPASHGVPSPHGQQTQRGQAANGSRAARGPGRGLMHGEPAWHERPDPSARSNAS